MMKNREIIFTGFDIYNFVKSICNQLLNENPNMTEGEKKAYKLGINNTLGFLEQTLNEAMEIDGNYYNIAVHIPKLKMMTEFATIEEVADEFAKIFETNN